MSDEINLLPEELKSKDERAGLGFGEEMTFHLPTVKLTSAPNSQNLDLLNKKAPGFFTKSGPAEPVAKPVIQPEIKPKSVVAPKKPSFWQNLFKPRPKTVQEVGPVLTVKPPVVPATTPDLIKPFVPAKKIEPETKPVVLENKPIARARSMPVDLPKSSVAPVRLPTIRANGHESWWKKLLAKIKPPVLVSNPVVEQKAVNLIPANIDLLSNKQIIFKLINSLVAGILFLALIAGGLFGYFEYLNKKSETLKNTVGPTKAMLDDDKKIISQAEKLKSQLAAVESVVLRHVYWTKFLDVLEEITADDVFYGNMAASPDGKVTIDAVAPSYSAVARQFVAYLKSPKVLGVSIPGANGSAIKQEVKFNVELLMQPEIYFEF